MKLKTVQVQNHIDNQYLRLVHQEKIVGLDVFVEIKTLTLLNAVIKV